MTLLQVFQECRKIGKGEIRLHFGLFFISLSVQCDKLLQNVDNLSQSMVLHGLYRLFDHFNEFNFNDNLDWSEHKS
jgi:hypothetical protein